MGTRQQRIWLRRKQLVCYLFSLHVYVARSLLKSQYIESLGDVTAYGPRCAADIGGTLAKLVFFKRNNVPKMPEYVKSDSDELGSALLPVKLDPRLSIESRLFFRCFVVIRFVSTMKKIINRRSYFFNSNLL